MGRFVAFWPYSSHPLPLFPSFYRCPASRIPPPVRPRDCLPVSTIIPMSINYPSSWWQSLQPIHECFKICGIAEPTSLIPADDWWNIGALRMSQISIRPVLALSPLVML
ncbi:MAG: hypothetical protein WCI51_03720 [Lentisphaerota bacterium]